MRHSTAPCGHNVYYNNNSYWNPFKAKHVGTYSKMISRFGFTLKVVGLSLQSMVVPGLTWFWPMWSLNRTAGPNCPPRAMSYCYSGVFVMEHVCLALILESGKAPLWCCWDLCLYLGLCLNRAWGIYSRSGTVSICTPLLCDLVI